MGEKSNAKGAADAAFEAPQDSKKTTPENKQKQSGKASESRAAGSATERTEARKAGEAVSALSNDGKRNRQKRSAQTGGRANEGDNVREQKGGKLTKSLASSTAQAKEALGYTEVLTGLALGCFLAWVPMSFQSLNIVSDAGEPVLDTVYLVSIFALLATQLFIGFQHALCARWIARGPVRAGAAVAMALSTLLLPLAANTAGPDAPTVSFAASAVATGTAGVLSGVASGIFLAQFGILISKFSAKATAAIAAIGYLLMSTLFCAYSFFGPLESCLFAASMPIISAFLRDTGASTAKGKAAISEKSLPPQMLPANADDRRNLNHLTLALALCSATVGCAYELARTLYIQMGIAGAGGENYAFTQAGATLIIGLGAIVLTLALVSMKTPRAPEVCYRILLLFLALGSLLLPVSLIYSVNVVFPYAINAAAFQCFSIMAWVLICGTCHQFPAASVRTFSFIRAGWTFGPIIGMLIGRFVARQTAFGLPEVFACALLGGVLVMLASLAFGAQDLVFAVNLLPTDKKRRFTDKCLAVAARCGLSERETEIMTLFAKGRNLAYIQDQLCLSKSTVSTHRQHIYQKLDVHSSQEMIDLIQDEKA